MYTYFFSFFLMGCCICLNLKYRVNKEAADQIQRRQEEMRRVREEIERQQEEIAPSQGGSQQEKGLR